MIKKTGLVDSRGTSSLPSSTQPSSTQPSTPPVRVVDESGTEAAGATSTGATSAVGTTHLSGNAHIEPGTFERGGAPLKGVESAALLAKFGLVTEKKPALEKKVAKNVRSFVAGLWARTKQTVQHGFSAMRTFGLAALRCSTLEDVRQLKDFATLAIENKRPSEIFGILGDVAGFLWKHPDEARRVLQFIDKAERDTWKQKSAWMAPVSHVVPDAPLLIKHADVVVIGGGLAGGSVARSFAKAGAGKNVLVIERDKKEDREHAASFRNAGIVCTALDYVFELDEAVGEKPIAKIADALKIPHDEAEKVYVTVIEILRDAAKRIDELAKEQGVDLELKPHGFLDIARTEDELGELKRAVDLARKHGLDWHVIDAAILGEKYGVERPGKIAGAVEFSDSAELHPGKMVKALFDAAASGGVEVQYDTNVTGVRPDESGAGWILETNQGEIHAKDVVDAREAFAPYHFREARFSQIHVIDIDDSKTADPHGPAGLGDTSVCHSLTYMRKMGAGKFLVGSGDFPVHSANEPPRPMASVALYAAAHFKKLFPDTPYNIERVWGGVFGTSPDELPVAGELVKNWHVVGGSGGSGLSFTPVLGAQVVDDILGKKSAGPLQPADQFSPRRFFLLELRTDLARALHMDVEHVRVDVGAPSAPTKSDGIVKFTVDDRTLDAMNTDAAVLFSDRGPDEVKRREAAKGAWIDAAVQALG